MPSKLINLLFSALFFTLFLAPYIPDNDRYINIDEENTVNSTCTVLMSFISSDHVMDCYLHTPYARYQLWDSKCSKFGVIWIVIRNADAKKVIIIKELKFGLLYARVYENDHKKGETHECWHNDDYNSMGNYPDAPQY